MVDATHRGGTLIQASAFQSCCAVYAPRYRQANGLAFLHPDGHGQRARDIAFDDIRAAFDRFAAALGERPYFIAAHSQGSVLATRLLRERIDGTPLADQLVAAYVPGAAIRPTDVGSLRVCDVPDQTGCVAAWNARGPDYQPNGLSYDADRPDTMAGRICTNPIHWDNTGSYAPATAQHGALFLDTENPALKRAFVDAQCRDGTLVVTDVGELERDLPSTILLWLMGPQNYHPVEYQLYFADLMHNIDVRLARWWAEQR